MNIKVRIEGCGIRATSLLRRFVEERSQILFAKNPQLLHLDIEVSDDSNGGSDPHTHVRAITCLPRQEIEESSTAMSVYHGMASILDKLDDRLKKTRWSYRFSGNRIRSETRAGSRSRKIFHVQRYRTPHKVS